MSLKQRRLVRPPEPQLTPENLAWAAGLFVGEGNVGRKWSRVKNGKNYAICLQLAMYDDRAVDRFADIVGVNAYWLWSKQRSKYFRKVQAAGRGAERILALLWPYLKHTDKGDQALRYARQLGIADWITGKKKGKRPWREHFGQAEFNFAR